MRIECTDGTAYWDWSDRAVHIVGQASGKRVDALEPGDVIYIAGPPRFTRTVLRVIGDTDYRSEGGIWTPIEPTDNGHPRSGVLYSCP